MMFNYAHTIGETGLGALQQKLSHLRPHQKHEHIYTLKMNLKYPQILGLEET